LSVDRQSLRIALSTFVHDSQNVWWFRNRDLDELVMAPRTTVFIQNNKNTEYFLVPKKTVCNVEDSEGKRVKRGGGIMEEYEWKPDRRRMTCMTRLMPWTAMWTAREGQLSGTPATLSLPQPLSKRGVSGEW
jgi:hypothetical protein